MIDITLLNEFILEELPTNLFDIDEEIKNLVIMTEEEHNLIEE